VPALGLGRAPGAPALAAVPLPALQLVGGGSRQRCHGPSLNALALEALLLLRA
jgi:hypothetical protein